MAITGAFVMTFSHAFSQFKCSFWPENEFGADSNPNLTHLTVIITSLYRFDIKAEQLFDDLQVN
jgi:hypothetical protein